MKESVIVDKSKAFALRIIKLYRYLCTEKHEYALSTTKTYAEIFLHTDCPSGQSVLLFTGGLAHEQKKEAADFAGTLRRQGRNRERIEESQTKGKDFAEPDLQAAPNLANEFDFEICAQPIVCGRIKKQIQKMQKTA